MFVTIKTRTGRAYLVNTSRIVWMCLGDSGVDLRMSNGDSLTWTGMSLAEAKAICNEK